MQSIRNRLLIIAGHILLSVFYLFPRTQTIRERGQDGVMRDVKVTRVPLKRGLDLQGGMHLALELDQSQRVSADPERDIDLALTVLRKRIDEFGVAEPVVQKSGNDRIVVELAGIADPGRAKNIVQKSAFLEFRIVDKTGALEKAIPSLDRILRGLGVQGGTTPARGANAVTKLLGDSGKAGDTTATADAGPGILAGLILPAGGGTVTPMPGAYMVSEAAYPRVDSMLNIAQVRNALPRGVELHWVNQPLSVGAYSRR